MKNISVLVRDKNTLILDEDATKGDIIDLTKLSKFDSSLIEQLIADGKDAAYNKRLLEAQEKFNLEKKNEIEALKSKIELLNTQNENKINEVKHGVEDRYKTQINELKNKLNSLKNELEAKSNLEIIELNNKLNLQKQEYENKLISLEKDKNLEKEKALFAKEKELNEKLTEKDNIISNLQNQKARLNVKQTGENLETYCNNIVQEQMQNGFWNCTWQKDNEVKKEEGENKGSKADYIFKIFSSNEHKPEDLLAAVCLDMKDENPDSSFKQTNEHYYKQLDNNRNKKNCHYAVLVSNLEMNQANALPIFKVREYDEMYVVRPGYLMTFLHLITSLTMKFKDLITSKEKEDLEIKNKLVFIEEFNNLKNTYLDKPLESLRKEIEDIAKYNENIFKASQKISDSCEKISKKYIDEIVSKLDKFEVKIEKEYKKLA